MEIQDAILGCRQRRPYYGAALLRLRPIESVRVPTMGVSETWGLYYSQKFLDKLNPAQAAAVIEHEIAHLLRGHHARHSASGAKNGAWNAAADAEINDDIESLPDGGIYPSSLGMPDHLLAEEYLAAAEGSCDGTASGHGSGASAEAADWEDAEAEAEAGPGVTPEEAERIRGEVASAIIAAPGAGAGNLIWARAIAASRKPRRRTLRDAMLDAQRGDSGRQRSWARPARRNAPGILRAGLIPAGAPRRAILLDCSGSMARVRREAVEQCLGLLQDGDWDLWGVDGDQVQSVSPNLLGLRALRGGADIDGEAALRVLASKRYKKIIVISDGGEVWGELKKNVEIVIVGGRK